MGNYGEISNVLHLTFQKNIPAEVAGIRATAGFKRRAF
jgi:hypothetical protein